MALTRKPKSKKAAVKARRQAGPRTLSHKIKHPQLAEVARDARLHGPQRLVLPDGQIVVVSVPRKRAKLTRQAKQRISLYDVVRNSPLARLDVDLDIPPVFAPVRDVDL